MMLRRSAKLTLTLLVVTASTGHAKLPIDGKIGDGVPTLVYNAESGDLTLECDGKRVATFELLANVPTFVGKRTADITEPFGQFMPNRIFTIRPDGFDRIQLGRCLEAKLKLEDLSRILTANGSLVDGNARIEFDLMLANKDHTTPTVNEKPTTPSPRKRSLVYVYVIELDREGFIELLRIEKRREFELWLRAPGNAAELRDQLQFLTHDNETNSVSITRHARISDRRSRSDSNSIQCEVSLDNENATISLTYRGFSPFPTASPNVARLDRSSTRSGELRMKYDHLGILFGTITDKTKVLVVSVEKLDPLNPPRSM